MGEERQKGGRCRCGGAPTCNVTPLHAGGLNRVFLMKLNRFVGFLNKLKRCIIKKQCLQVIKNKWVLLLELELENLDMPENTNCQCFYYTKKYPTIFHWHVTI